MSFNSAGSAFQRVSAHPGPSHKSRTDSSTKKASDVRQRGPGQHMGQGNPYEKKPSPEHKGYNGGAYGGDVALNHSYNFAPAGSAYEYEKVGASGSPEDRGPSHGRHIRAFSSKQQ